MTLYMYKYNINCNAWSDIFDDGDIYISPNFNDDSIHLIFT